MKRQLWAHEAAAARGVRGAHLINLIFFFMWLRQATKPVQVWPQPAHS